MTNSPRIQEICNQVNSKVIAEVGCDHAYITKELLDNGKIDFAYLTDISEKCLEKAIINLRKYKKHTHFCVGNGLMALNNTVLQQQEEIYNKVLPHVLVTLKNRDKVDKNVVKAFSKVKEDNYPNIEQIIIAGMGGQEIIKILDQNDNCLYNNFILQPQKNIIELRIYLQENNYEILKDELVQEGKMFYFIINAKKVNKKPTPLSIFQLYFGSPTNKENLENYLNYELEKRKKISSQKKFIENETLIRLIEQYLLEL